MPEKKRRRTTEMQYHEDRYVSVSFSLPKSVKERLDRRAIKLGFTRTDYLKLLLMADLDRGEDAPFMIERRPREIETREPKGRKQAAQH